MSKQSTNDSRPKLILLCITGHQIGQKINTKVYTSSNLILIGLF